MRQGSTALLKDTTGAVVSGGIRNLIHKAHNVYPNTTVRHQWYKTWHLLFQENQAISEYILSVVIMAIGRLQVSSEPQGS